MIVVAIETATVEVGVAISGPSGLLAMFTARPGRRHVETLHPALQAVCAGAGLSLSDVDAVVVDVGPGLFTGIRVGVAAAQGLALGLGVPVATCFSTEVLVHACRHVALDVVPVVDMRRGEVAWSIPEEACDDRAVRSSRDGGDGGRLSMSEPRLGTVDALATLLSARGRSSLLVGDGARRHGDKIAAAVTAAGGVPPSIGGDMLAAPPVAALAELGIQRANAGLVAQPEDLVPLYLRAPDARINWTSRAGAPAPSPPSSTGSEGVGGLRPAR